MSTAALAEAAEGDGHGTDTLFALDRQTLLRRYAARYMSYGWTPYRLRERDKRPPGKKEANVLTAENSERLLTGNTHNLGVLLGSQSDGLIDVDLDWPEACLVGSAVFGNLPCFGRASAPKSHRLVRCPDAEKIVKFTLPASVSDPRLPDKHAMTVLEVRGTGHHTMFPPSIHPNGEEVKWEVECEPPTLNWAHLKQRAGLAAFLAVCIRFWPAEGSRDETSMALAGALLSAGLDTEKADKATKFVAYHASDEEYEKRAKAPQTAARRANGEPTTGMPRLVELLGLPSDCVNVFHKWLGTKTDLDTKDRNDGEGVTILDLAAPRDNARQFIKSAFSLDEHRTLVFHRDEYFVFDKGRYRPLELTALQNSLYGVRHQII